MQHIVKWSAGGPTTVDNGRLRCVPHNRANLPEGPRQTSARPAEPIDVVFRWGAIDALRDVVVLARPEGFEPPTY
jgi:hypothetical protein